MSFGSVVLRHRYYLLEGSRDDSSGFFVLITSHHCVSLTAASLAICENCPIVPFKNVVYQWEGALLIDEHLGAFDPKDIVEGEVFW